MTEASKQLGITRAAFSRVINGKASIYPEMALRIKAWLGEGNSDNACVWLSLQATYDLWQVRKSGLPKVKHAFIPILV